MSIIPGFVIYALASDIRIFTNIGKDASNIFSNKISIELLNNKQKSIIYS